MTQQPIEIVNRGGAIARTNYWASQPALDGYLHCSGNAGALRILVPLSAEHQLLHLPPVDARGEIASDVIDGRAVYRLTWRAAPAAPIVIDQQGSGELPRGAVGRFVPLVWYVAAGAWGVAERRRELVRIGLVVVS